MAAPRVAPGRVRRRLTVAFVLVAAMAAAVLAAGSYLTVRAAWFDASLAQATVDTRYQLVLAGQFLPLDEERTTGLLTSFEGGGRHVVLVADAGTAASHPAFATVPGPAVRAEVAAGRLAFQRMSTRDGSHLLVVGGRIPGSTAELYVVHAEDRIYADLDQLRAVLLAGSALVVLLAALIGHVLARRTLSPVGRAGAAARAVAEGLLATRLPVGTRDEFGAWAESFNRMAEALEAKIAALSRAQARERRFTADVAHELRTPVTALVAAASLVRGHLDELPTDVRRPTELLVANVLRLRRLVDELMEISRLDAGREHVTVRPVDLGGLVDAILGSRGWSDRVTVTGTAPPIVTDPRRLERILSNVIANAVEHGGRDVRVTIASADGTVTVRVTDRGPGIPAAHLPHLFDRFYKADPARTGAGSGLGLAIARENARLLGADITVRTEPDAGTEFRITVPVAHPLPDGDATANAGADGGGQHQPPPGGPQ